MSSREGDQSLSQKCRLMVGQGGSKCKTRQAGSHSMCWPCRFRSLGAIVGAATLGDPCPPGDPPYLEPAESPSKWKLVEELRRMRRQGGPWKGGKEGIRVQTGTQPFPHMNLSTQTGWGLHSEQLEPWF